MNEREETEVFFKKKAQTVVGVDIVEVVEAEVEVVG